MTTLTSKTLGTIRNAFASPEYNQKLSRAMWKDIAKTTAHLERMADGKLPPKYYLNALATGVGKTTNIISFIGALVASSDHKEVGAIICVPLKDEIKQLIAAMRCPRFPEDGVHIFTSDLEVNALGSTDADKSQVLITTQQMIGQRLADGKSFADLKQLYFNGKPRLVKIWDEALIPWEELVLDVYKLARLSSVLVQGDPDAAKKVIGVVQEIVEIKRSSSYDFPDLGFNMHDLRKDIFAQAEESSEDRKAAETLCKLSGKTVRVVHDPRGPTIISWRDSLPADFMPVMVFDASGKVRTLYDHYARSSGQLEVMTSSEKRFDNVTFHHVNMGAGKSQWRQTPTKLLQATAACINNEPDRECLVIHTLPDQVKPRAGGVPDIPKALSELLRNKAKVHYRTWGRHKQTNDYRHLDKIVLAGLWYLRPSVYEVRARGSLKLKNDHELSRAQHKAVELGELQNDILQAVGRICVRRCIKEQSPEADVYIIASSKAGHNIPDMLRDTFPGCTVETFAVPGATKQKWEQALDVIHEFFDREHLAFLPIADVAEALGIGKSNFNRDVRAKAAFKKALAAASIYEFSASGGYKTHFYKRPF